MGRPVPSGRATGRPGQARRLPGSGKARVCPGAGNRVHNSALCRHRTAPAGRSPAADRGAGAPERGDPRLDCANARRSRRLLLETRWRLVTGPHTAGGGVKWVPNEQTERRPPVAAGSKGGCGAAEGAVHSIGDGPAFGVAREPEQLVDAAAARLLARYQPSTATVEGTETGIVRRVTDAVRPSDIPQDVWEILNGSPDAIAHHWVPRMVLRGFTQHPEQDDPEIWVQPKSGAPRVSRIAS